MLPESWFTEHGFTQAPPEVVDGRIAFAHPEGRFVDEHGTPLAIAPLRGLEHKNGHGAFYPTLSAAYGNAKCHLVMIATFERMPDKTEQCDHINGNPNDCSLSNLRIVKIAINYRDGGFLKKLRNKGIDPTMFSREFLLRYFDRMAEYKSSHSLYRYYHLTHDDLLRMLVSPEFEVVDPASRMDYDLTHHMEC